MADSRQKKRMNISVLIATYGEELWRDLAWSRAHPSVTDADEILCFHDPEGTIASVRNELGQQAKGDWLLYLDADDELAPGYLDAMKRAGGRESGRQDGVPLLLTPAVSQVRRGKVGEPHFFDRGISLRDDNWLVLGTLVPRDLFLEVGGFSDYPHGFEDWSLWAKCWKAGAEIIKVPDAIYRYHINPNSIHRRAWRDRRTQISEHRRIQAELFG